MKKSLINPLQNNLVGGNHTPDGNAGGGWGASGGTSNRSPGAGGKAIALTVAGSVLKWLELR